MHSFVWTSASHVGDLLRVGECPVESDLLCHFFLIPGNPGTKLSRIAALCYRILVRLLALVVNTLRLDVKFGVSKSTLHGLKLEAPRLSP